MQDAKMKSDIDELLSELEKPVNSSNTNNTPVPQIQAPILTNSTTSQELKDFVIQQSAKLLLSNINLVDNLRLKVMAGSDPDSINAFASLVNSTTKSLKELNALVLQDEKAKSAKEVAESKNKSAPNTQNNYFIATREEVFENILKKAQESNVIDLDNDVEGMKAPPKPGLIDISGETPQSEES